MDTVGPSALLPSDCVAALRSFPRRFTAALEPVLTLPEVRDRDALATRPDPDGTSALQLLRAAAASAEELQQAAHEMLRTEQPQLPAAPLSAPGNATEGAAKEIEALLVTVGRGLLYVAERLDELPTAAWQRTGREPTGAVISLLEVTRRQVGAIAACLRGIDRALSAGRSDAEQE